MHVYIHPWRTWQSVSHDSHVIDGFVASRAFRRRLRKTYVLSLRDIKPLLIVLLPGSVNAQTSDTPRYRVNLIQAVAKPDPGA